MGLSEFLEVPMDTEKQTTKAQRNLSISVAKIGQLRVSDTMFVKGPLSSTLLESTEDYKSNCRIHCKGHEALLTLKIYQTFMIHMVL
jgi:hypothetical protein